MGMYTEFIFGCTLSKNTPKICIDALDYSINGKDKKPKFENPIDWSERSYNDHFIDRTESIEDIEEFCEEYDFGRLFHSCSYYFGAANPVGKFYYDPIDYTYKISTRADLKNYERQIEKFLEYIEPYVKYGSGPYSIFAYVHYEENKFPIIYSKDGKFKINGEEIA